jgi:hypothetical protein
VHAGCAGPRLTACELQLKEPRGQLTGAVAQSAGRSPRSEFRAAVAGRQASTNTRDQQLSKKSHSTLYEYEFANTSKNCSPARRVPVQR